MVYEDEIAKIVETYGFEELLELNDLTEIDVILLLLRDSELKLPEHIPIDYDPSEE